MPQVDLRLAENEVDAVLVFRAMMMMHAEDTVPGSLNKVKALTNVFRMVQGPGSVVLMAMDGEALAGFLALYEEGYWYNDERHLGDKGFYVLPEYRGTEAATLLLNAAKRVSDDTGFPVFITINNGRRRRGGGSGWERLGATLGYHPQGAVLAHFPGG